MCTLIKSAADLEVFNEGPTKERLLQFVATLAEGVKTQKAADLQMSPLMTKVLACLEILETIKAECPVVHTSKIGRFGNPAFESFQVALPAQFVQPFIDQVCPQCAPEVQEYVSSLLMGSFGNRERRDYGTGHELSFLLVLYVFFRENLLTKADFPVAVLIIFKKYVDICRDLQNYYVLEPAGSRGAWGLDDYNFLGFLFGAGQLIGTEIPVESFIKEEIDDKGEDYLFFNHVRHVLRVKKGVPLSESSQMLYNMSCVPTWEKVRDGLIRMYAAEVLGKFPVMQHCLFGPHFAILA